MYPSIGMENENRIGDPGHLRSLGQVAWIPNWLPGWELSKPLSEMLGFISILEGWSKSLRPKPPTELSGFLF